MLNQNKIGIHSPQNAVVGHHNIKKGRQRSQRQVTSIEIDEMVITVKTTSLYRDGTLDSQMA
jgi:hypothetical protein